jgi:hypothetical protein
VTLPWFYFVLDCPQSEWNIHHHLSRGGCVVLCHVCALLPFHTLPEGNTLSHTKRRGEIVSTILSDRTDTARLLPKSYGLLLNPKGILPGVGEKLAPPWFGGGSPLHGALQLPPCAGAYPHGKSSGCLTIIPACPGPSRDPICQVSTWRDPERMKTTRTKCTKINIYHHNTHQMHQIIKGWRVRVGHLALNSPRSTYLIRGVHTQPQSSS